MLVWKGWALLALGVFVAAQAQGPSTQGPKGEAGVQAAAQGSDDASGRGDVSIYPTRVLLEGRERSAEVMLRNTGNGVGRYRIFFTEMEMDENGDLQNREKVKGDQSLSDWVRYSPRSVELAPGEMQVVRLHVRKPAGLSDGEYRSHLVFQAIPPPDAPAPVLDNSKEKLSVKVNTLMAISIPVIVRHGKTEGRVTLSDLRFWRPDMPDVPHVLSLKMHGEGNRSLVGNFEVWVDQGGKLKKGTLLWERHGVTLYDQRPFRHVHFPLYQAKDGDLKGARLKVVFTPKDFKGEPVAAYLELPS